MFVFAAPIIELRIIGVAQAAAHPTITVAVLSACALRFRVGFECELAVELGNVPDEAICFFVIVCQVFEFHEHRLADDFNCHVQL